MVRPTGTFPYTDDQLREAGLLGEGVSELTTQVLNTMRKHPDLLNVSLFVLQCIEEHERKGTSSSPRAPGSPALNSDATMASNPSTLASASGAAATAAVSKHGPNAYEKTSYYYGLCGDSRDHPDLLYRSDYLTTPFPTTNPVGSGRNRAPPVVKSARGVFGTQLNRVWGTVGRQIIDLIKARKIRWSSVNPARFFTEPPLGGEEEEEEEKEAKKGSLGPVVIWISVYPGSTSADVAHEVSQEILALLQKNGVDDVVVEWYEAVVERL